MPKTSKSPANGFQRYFLMTVLVILLALLITFISPFAVDLLLAGVIVTAVYPVHRRVLNKIRFSRSLAALVSMILIIIVILVPFTSFGFFIAQQATDAYIVVSDRINTIVATHDVSTVSKVLELVPFNDKIAGALKYLPVSTADLLKTAGDAVGTVSSFLLSKTTNILKHLSIFLVHALVFLITLFYFLREGDQLVDYIRSLLPLSKTYRQELFTKLSHLSYGIIYGIFGAALLQGFLVGVGFAFAGINNPAFWGAIAALFSPVPYIGTMVIWLPAVLVLGFSGHWVTALLLFLWSAFIVGTADNVIKPYIIGAQTQLHPMATLLVLLGGTFVFGLKGLLFGPLILTAALAFIHIYSLEYKAILQSDEKPVVPKGPVKKRKIRK